MELDKRQIKAIIFTAIGILAIVLLFIIIAIVSVARNESQNKNVNVSTGFSSIKQIVEHYNSTYKKDTYVQNREYPTEIELVFKCDLYENGESNEEFFNDIINDIVKFVNYTNVRFIDETRDIEIKVICKNGSIDSIIINDIEDYFIYMDSQAELSKYKEIDTINLSANSEELIQVINNNWNSNTYFGTRESIFRNYNICFDEGIEYRKIGSNIYNIIFTKNYNGPVVNNLTVGIDLDAIEDYFGKAPFKDEDLKVIGYKGLDFYTFFTEDEISIYRKVTTDYSDFWELADRFLDEELDFKDFMNELTYIWPDYSEYNYDSNYMFISYPTRGVDVKLNDEDISGIVLYNNITEKMDTVRKYLKNTEFVSRLQVDNTFEAEKRRIETAKEGRKLSTDFTKEVEEQYKDDSVMLFAKRSYLYDLYFEKDNNDMTVTTYFYSKDGQNVNRELNEPVISYVWATDNLFIYSLYAKGIYCYNVITGEKFTLIEGNDAFLIDKYQNNILTYDKDKTLEISY